MDYTMSEYCDMLIIYDECDQNSSIAAKEYAARFPAKEISDGQRIFAFNKSVRETEYTMPMKDLVCRGSHARTEENEEAILLAKQSY